MQKKITIIQTKSAIGCLSKHKSTLLGLGLRHINHTIKREDTPSIRGMIKKIYYMVKIKD